MQKAITSAPDFLAAITGGTEVFEVGGVTVELRSLTFAEVQRLANQYQGDATEMAFQALALGLVSPVLTPEQLGQVRDGRPGPLMKMAQRVMQISGMTEDTENFPGAGLSSPAATSSRSRT